MEHHDATGVSPRDKRCEKLVRTGLNGCSAMARPLTHLTQGISTRRPFPPAKIALIMDELANPLAHPGLNRIEPIVEKINSRFRRGLRGIRLRGNACHGVVSSPTH